MTVNPVYLGNLPHQIEQIEQLQDFHKDLKHYKNDMIGKIQKMKKRTDDMVQRSNTNPTTTKTTTKAKQN